MDIENLIRVIAVYAIPVLLAITLHEAAHGYVARYFGDHTAAMLGRITLNPFKHVDPVGTIVLPLLVYLGSGGAFLFGYAKPVPVVSRNLRNPKRDMMWVAAAGPASNFVQALLWMVVWMILIRLNLQENFFMLMAKGGVVFNLVLAAFNLLPLPPLDGGRVAVGLLPPRLAYKFAQIERYGFFILLAIILIGAYLRHPVLWTYWLSPLVNAGIRVIDFVLQPLHFLLF